MENVGERRSAYRVWWRNLRAREHLEDPGLCGKVNVLKPTDYVMHQQV